MNDLWDADKDHHLRRALAVFGPRAQEIQAIEEMAELTIALLHRKRGKADKPEVLSEMADVLIMLRQLSFLYGEDELREAVNAKMQKLVRNLQDPVARPLTPQEPHQIRNKD